MKICTKCVLPETFPSIKFDENGVCNYCLNYKGFKIQDTQKQKLKDKFVEILKKYKGKATYDCLLAYSGGKDSTYTLHILKEHFQLKILAVTFDNWFQSEISFKNIRTVLSHLNVDHLILRPKYDVLKKIFRTVSEHNIYSPKTIERASTICTTCLSLIRFSCLRLAIEKEIPFVVFGLSPGQADVNTSVFKNNSIMIKSMQKAIYYPLYNIVGEEINPYFLEEKHFNKSDRFPYNINLLAFWEYDEKMMINEIRRFGWEKPDDTDANSTNCLLNSLGIAIHKDRYGYNPYASELSKLVREGYLSREEAISRLESEEYKEILKIVQKKLME